MIVNTLKECCENCSFIDGYIDTTLNENCTENFAVVSTIYCGHREVCKKYIEQLQKECKDIVKEFERQTVTEG